MKIGIIGAVNIALRSLASSAQRGTGLAGQLARAREIRDIAKGWMLSAVALADVARRRRVAVSIPQRPSRSCRRHFFTGLPSHVVVIETGNYYPGMLDHPVGSDRRGTAREPVGRAVLGRPVVKAFNRFRRTAGRRGPASRAREDASRCRWRATRPTRRASPSAGSAMRLRRRRCRLLGESWRQQPARPRIAPTSWAALR